MNSILLVAAGGFLGAAARYLLGKYINGLWKGSFPLGTFIINATGSFLLGLVVLNPALSASLGEGVGMGIGIGFLGSYTTFSTLEYETMKLLEKRKTAVAAAYVLASFSTGFLAAFLAGKCYY